MHTDETEQIWDDLDDDERYEAYLDVCQERDRLIGQRERVEANEARWIRRLLEDFKIPFDDHLAGRRTALVRWMIEHQTLGRRQTGIR